MARTMIGLLAGLGCLAALSQAQPATGLTITVPFDQPTIQAGIEVAQPGDTVLVVPGVWSGAGNEELNFLGKDIVVSGYGPDQTIVDLGGIQNAPCVRFASGETRAAVLRDLTFRNGNCRDTAPGIRVQNASPSILNVRLDNLDGWSDSGGLGAALWVLGGSPLCEDLLATNGTGGGTVMVTGGSPVFVDCEFTDNSTREYGNGGAAYITGGTATFADCRFIGNFAHNAGGALYSESSESVLLQQCWFEANDCWGSLWEYEPSGGGAVAAVNALVAVVNCTFVDNSGGPHGGALFSSGGGAGVIGSLFIGNESSAGASLALLDGTQTITSSTFVDSEGSAILCAGTGMPQLRQLILAGGTNAGFVGEDSSTPVIECCDVFDFPAGGYGGTLADLTDTAGNISQNPLFCGDLNPEQPYAISSSSPCAAGNNDCGQLIGAFAPGCDAAAFLVAGTVRDSAGLPLGGVEMQGLPGSPLSDANGHFAASILAGSDLDLQPLLPGHVFQPPRVLITAIEQDWPDLEFTGTATRTHRVPADHPDIAAAILAALDGDTVLIAPGTYTGPGNRNLNPQGRDLVIRSAMGSATTHIDLQGQGRLIVYNSGESSASRLEGLTISSGNAALGEDPGGSQVGGAAYIASSSPRLTDLRISGCQATSGGALFLSYSNTCATDLQIHDCHAEFRGGGLGIGGSGVYPVFSQLSISGCSAAVDGGAIFLWGSAVTVAHATITGNACAGNGGALHVRSWETHLVLSHCILFANSAQHGGGIHAQDSDITIDYLNCDIFRNAGGDFGGFARAMDPAQGNFRADPLFCDASSGLLTLDADSPCAAANHPAGTNIGAFPVGCDLPTVTLSGYLRTAEGAPLAGAQVRGVDCCGASDALGCYAIELPAGWSGDLRAWLPGYDWTPAARSYQDLTSDLADQDYSATRVTRREVPAEQPDIQSALDLAADGDSVLVAPGTYAGPGNRDLRFDGRSLQLIGSAGAVATVIDCEGLGRGLCFTQGEDSTALVAGFTVRNGNTASTGVPNKGGGLLISGASPTLHELVIEDCYASESGGGIYADYASPRLSDLVLRRNQTALEWPGGSGGGLYCAYGAPRITGSLFVDNACYVRGGGICASYGAQLQAEGLTLAGNRAGTAGGGLGLQGTMQATLAACLISGNEAPSGGGIHAAQSYSDVSLACCDVAENEGGNYGGYADDVTGEDGNIAVDPLFCEPGLGDYRLEAHSVCLPSNNSCRVQIGALGIGCEAVALPDDELPPPFALAQNHPNPFNPRTTIAFSIPAPGATRLSVYAVDGRLVATLVDGPLAAGPHAIVWNGRDDSGRRLPSGIYQYRLEAGAERTERKLLLLK